MIVVFYLIELDKFLLLITKICILLLLQYADTIWTGIWMHGVLRCLVSISNRFSSSFAVDCVNVKTLTVSQGIPNCLILFM